LCGHGRVFGFDFQWRLVTQGRVKPLAIVEDLDVLEDGGAQLDTPRPASLVDELGFDGGEEALDDGIVPAVAFATHADCDALSSELGAVLSACVLAAAVGVVQQALDRPARP